MTDSRKWGILIVFGAIAFLFTAFFGLLPAVFAVLYISVRMIFSIGLLYVTAWAKNSSAKAKSQ
ncbi:MAG: hypothetical protein WBZ37_28805 [Mycobacterium sp.]